MTYSYEKNHSVKLVNALQSNEPTSAKWPLGGAVTTLVQPWHSFFQPPSGQFALVDSLHRQDVLQAIHMIGAFFFCLTKFLLTTTGRCEERFQHGKGSLELLHYWAALCSARLPAIWPRNQNLRISAQKNVYKKSYIVLCLNKLVAYALRMYDIVRCKKC